MKIVINQCFGGFGLSHKAVMRYAELKDTTLYYEKEGPFGNRYTLVPSEEYEKIYNEDVEKQNYQNSSKLRFSEYNIDRTDSDLIQVVEELGEESWGHCAELKIVDVPDLVNYEILEYDGVERIREVGEEWY